MLDLDLPFGFDSMINSYIEHFLTLPFRKLAQFHDSDYQYAVKSAEAKNSHH
jgi:hypothetical protein